MKTNCLIKFLGRSIRNSRPGRGSRVLFVCVGAAMLLDVTSALAQRGGGGQARGGRQAGAGAGGVAPWQVQQPATGAGSAGAGDTAAGASGGRAGVGAGGVGAAGSGPGTSAGAGGVGAAGAGGGARGAGVAPGAGVGSLGAGALPRGYVQTLPAGCTTAYYRGYWCHHSDGVYYRPAYYGGAVVYTEVPADTTELPEGYYYSIAPGFTSVTYKGYTCYYVNGVYYRIVTYNGIQVFAVVP